MREFALGVVMGAVVVVMFMAISVNRQGGVCPQKEGGVPAREQGIAPGNDGGCLAGYTMRGGWCYVRNS